MISKTSQGGTGIDLRKRVDMTATEKHPYYKMGHQFKVSPMQVPKLKENEWAVEGHVEKDSDQLKVPAKEAATGDKKEVIKKGN